MSSELCTTDAHDVLSDELDYDDADVDDENDGLLALRDGDVARGAVDGGELQRANLLLLLAEWMETTGEGLHDDIVLKYNDAERIAGRFERTHFRAACYWDSLLVDIERRYMRAGSLQV